MQSIKTEYTANVEIGYGQLNRVMSWCRESLGDDSWHISEINYNAEQSKSIYQFKFTNEQHLLLFQLKWA